MGEWDGELGRGTGARGGGGGEGVYGSVWEVGGD